MQIHNRKELKLNRKNLRSNLTPAEARLWKFLQNSQLDGRKFRRQHSIGNFIVDFYCPKEKLAIELDGDIHFNPVNEKYDEDRSKYIESLNIKVLRFKNDDIFDAIEVVLDTLRSCFNRYTTPAPPKIGGD